MYINPKLFIFSVAGMRPPMGPMMGHPMHPIPMGIRPGPIIAGPSPAKVPRK